MICSYKGTIMLYANINSFPIRILRYHTRKHRQRIIDIWGKEVGKEKILSYIIQIAPDVDYDNTYKEELLARKIKRINKKPPKCHQIRLKEFTLITSVQYKTKSWS